MKTNRMSCTLPCSNEFTANSHRGSSERISSFYSKKEKGFPEALIPCRLQIIKIASFLVTTFLLVIITAGCEKEKETPFTLLTEPVWVSDSLLVNGVDASGPGQILANFNGEARFLPDGTGLFANFTGTWRFAQNDTRLIITSPDYPVPITTIIEELSRANLKISTELPDPRMPGVQMRIRMTFKSRR